MILRFGRGGTIYVYDTAAPESRNKRLTGLNPGSLYNNCRPRGLWSWIANQVRMKDPSGRWSRMCEWDDCLRNGAIAPRVEWKRFSAQEI